MQSNLTDEHMKFFRSRITKDEADKLVEIIFPAQEFSADEDFIAQTLITVVMLLGYDNEWQRRDFNARALVHSIYSRTSVSEMAHSVFMDNAIQSLLPVLAGQNASGNLASELPQ